MPPAAVVIPVNSVIEVRCRYRMYQQELMSVFHYTLEEDSAPYDTLGNDVVAALGGAPGSLLVQIQNAQCNVIDFYAIDVQPIYPIRYSFQRVAGPGFGVRPAVEDADPVQNLAASITKLCPATGKGLHGTLHLPGVPAQAYVQGRYTADYKTFLELLAGALSLPGTLAGGGIIYPILYNRAQPLVFQYITDAVPQDTVRVMRRRTVGLGI